MRHMCHYKYTLRSFFSVKLTVEWILVIYEAGYAGGKDNLTFVRLFLMVYGYVKLW